MSQTTQNLKLIACATLINLFILQFMQSSNAQETSAIDLTDTNEHPNDIESSAKIPHRLEEFLLENHRAISAKNKRSKSFDYERQKPTKITQDLEPRVEVEKSLRDLQQQILQEHIRNSMAEKDHLMMEKWLVDNIKDLHRELKQTENDFEHYVQVTKNVLLRNEHRLKQQLSAATSIPLHMPIGGMI